MNRSRLEGARVLPASMNLVPALLQRLLIDSLKWTNAIKVGSGESIDKHLPVQRGMGKYHGRDVF